jgi:hypothetical protein
MKVRIGPIDFEVVSVDGLTDAEGSRKLSGHISYDHCKIELEQRISEQAKYLVFWHEVFHAIFTQYGLEPEGEEKLIDALANGIVDFLRDNPTLKLEVGDV